jgi:hypothetical protein
MKGTKFNKKFKKMVEMSGRIGPTKNLTPPVHGF